MEISTFRALARLLLARQHADYLRTGNPIYAWRALRIARTKGRRGDRFVPVVPEWVLEYLDGCASALEQATTPDAMLAAVGLHQARGGAGKREQARTHDRNERIVDAIVTRLESGEGITAAIRAAARAHNVSPERARGIYSKAEKRDATLRQKLSE